MIYFATNQMVAWCFRVAIIVHYMMEGANSCYQTKEKIASKDLYDDDKDPKSKLTDELRSYPLKS